MYDTNVLPASFKTVTMKAINKAKANLNVTEGNSTTEPIDSAGESPKRTRKRKAGNGSDDERTAVVKKKSPRGKGKRAELTDADAVGM